jgi:adenylylsulfate kinase-like enzyme
MLQASDSPGGLDHFRGVDAPYTAPTHPSIRRPVSDEKETARLQYEKQVAAEQQAERDRIEQGEREAEALKEQNR